jgi:hypothetical protein
MPFIRKKESIITHADACGGGGMKKSGIATTMGWSRISNKIFRSSTPQKVPPFKLTCCGRSIN